MKSDELLRKLFRLPDPKRVTPWAYEVCCEHFIEETQLYQWLLDNGEDFSTAYRMVWGPYPHEVFGENWKALAEYMRRAFGWSLEETANCIMGWHSSQNISTVRRALDPDAREKQRQYDRDYWARLQQDNDKYQKRLEAMRQYSREHYRRRKKDT